MRLVNLTCSPVRLVSNGVVNTIPVSGRADVEIDTKISILCSGVRIVEKKFGAVTGLPKFDINNMYIVKEDVALASKRNDLLVVDEPIFGENHEIIGFKSLKRL